MELLAKSRDGLADRRAQAGFTLVEMLAVIAIIGLIMGLVGPRMLSYLGESKVKAAKLQIESFASSLDRFYLDVGRYPTSSEGLAALTERPSNTAVWNGPYLKTDSVPLDPWEHAYVYRLLPNMAPIRSRRLDPMVGRVGPVLRPTSAIAPAVAPSRKVDDLERFLGVTSVSGRAHVCDPTHIVAPVEAAIVRRKERNQAAGLRGRPFARVHVFRRTTAAA
jgi:general secretion pathway protein G